MEEADFKKKKKKISRGRFGTEKLRSMYELRRRGVMGEDEPWGFEWTEKREDVRRQLRRHIQGLLGVRQEWQGKESRRRNGDAEQLPPHPRSSPVRSELAAAAQEQLGFSSVIAVASALAPVNEAEDAAELRDCPSCHAPPQDWCSNKATPTEAGQHGGVTTLSGRRSLLWTAPSHLVELCHQGLRGRKWPCPHFWYNWLYHVLGTVLDVGN